MRARIGWRVLLYAGSKGRLDTNTFSNMEYQCSSSEGYFSNISGFQLVYVWISLLAKNKIERFISIQKCDGNLPIWGSLLTVQIDDLAIGSDQLVFQAGKLKKLFSAKNKFIAKKVFSVKDFSALKIFLALKCFWR